MPSRGNSAIGRAFTLIELLVVIAIIALLIGILLPAIGKARDTARGVICQTNVRSVAQAGLIYAVDFKGRFPPVLGGQFVLDPENGKRNMVWHDVNRIGRYLPESEFRNVNFDNADNQTVGGGVLQCPNHPDGARSYSMNYWAASAAEVSPLNTVTGLPTFLKPGANSANSTTFQNGQGFNDDTSRASELILFGEAWAPFKSQEPLDGIDTTWFTQGSIGSRELPGERFGGGDGIPANIFMGSGGGNWAASPPSPELAPNLSVMPTSYLPYYRHPRRDNDLKKIDGSVNISFADGHVSNFSARDLFEEVDGSTNEARSSYKALWSLKDFELERDLRD